jgi:hypothetical protein
MALEVLKGGKSLDVPSTSWDVIGEHKNVHFYCKRLGLDDLILTPDVEKYGDMLKYHVVSQRNPGRVFPVWAYEIVPTDSKEATKAQLDDGQFSINLAPLPQIKDFLLTKFIVSYNWQSVGDMTAEQVRAEWLSKAKQPRYGIARQVEDERLQGYFLDTSTFIERMTKRVEGFPWIKFAEFLKFDTPVT